MNEIQKSAYVEGANKITRAFQSGSAIDQPTLTAWVNKCLDNDNTVETKVQLHTRDDDGNLAKTTTLEGRRSELAGYRLVGAFAAVEVLRLELAAKGVRFSAKTPA